MTKLETLQQLLAQKQSEIKELELILSDLIVQKEHYEYGLHQPAPIDLIERIDNNFGERWAAYAHHNDIMGEIEKVTRGEKSE